MKTNQNQQPQDNLKIVFRSIRDYFAGNMTGVTRDETIASIVIRMLFCKIFDESRSIEQRLFTFDDDEPEKDLEKRIQVLFSQVKKSFREVFDESDSLELDGSNLKYLVSILHVYEISSMNRDVIGDAFEEFIGTAYRGGEGQFFTPRNVVQMMVEVLDPSPGEKIIDPACGSGGFLAYAIRHVENQKPGSSAVFGIDKDSFLAKISRTYTSLLLGRESNVFCENSLDLFTNWNTSTQSKCEAGTFDVILTNPPFGAKIPVVGRELLGQYNLSQKVQNGKLIQLTKQPPQVLFIERCVQLLKPGGRMGMVLPEGIFGNASDKYIWDYLESVGTVTGVVSLAQEAFQPSTHTKTSVLFFEKSHEAKPVFMAIASKIGHNKNGKTTYLLDSKGQPVLAADGNLQIDDEIPEITRRFQSLIKKGEFEQSHLGFTISQASITNKIFIPEYYNPEVISEIRKLYDSKKFSPLTIGEMIENGWVKISRGKEIGSHFYGTGDIPFIRTSDIVNWELKIDPIKGVSEDVYDMFSKSQDIQSGDVLFVNDGTFLIGRTAMVTPLESRILIQSHVKKFRVTDKCPFSSYYLLYLLNTQVVKDQIKAKTFVQATISTIGDRLQEIVVPVHSSAKLIQEMSNEIEDLIKMKSVIRERTRNLLGT
jgi:type I restriction enzyme M protein